MKKASNKVKRMGIIPSSDSVPFVGHGENNIAISLFSFQKQYQVVGMEEL